MTDYSADKGLTFIFHIYPPKCPNPQAKNVSYAICIADLLSRLRISWVSETGAHVYYTQGPPGRKDAPSLSLFSVSARSRQVSILVSFICPALFVWGFVVFFFLNFTLLLCCPLLGKYQARSSADISRCRGAGSERSCTDIDHLLCAGPLEDGER